MGNQPLVSIVLPVFNGEKYIKEAIKSIISQIYQNWELIVIDDCSADKTAEIVKAFVENDSRVKYYKNIKNYKLPRSLNIGFSKAKGKYYTWTSDDNILLPDAIKKMVQVLEHNKEASMVYANYSVIDENGIKIKDIELPESKELITGNVFGACFMYSAKAAKLVGEYDVNLFLAEDYDYWIRMKRVGGITHLNEILYLYRLHASSLTETKKKLIACKTYEVLEKNFFYLYCFSRERNKQYAFFDYMLEKYSGQKKELILRLSQIDKGYSFYIFKKQLKNSIKKLKIWLILRWIKRKFISKLG